MNLNYSIYGQLGFYFCKLPRYSTAKLYVHVSVSSFSHISLQILSLTLYTKDKESSSGGITTKSPSKDDTQTSPPSKATSSAASASTPPKDDTTKEDVNKSSSEPAVVGDSESGAAAAGGAAGATAAAAEAENPWSGLDDTAKLCFKVSSKSPKMHEQKNSCTLLYLFYTKETRLDINVHQTVEAI